MPAHWDHFPRQVAGAEAPLHPGAAAGLPAPGPGEGPEVGVLAPPALGSWGPLTCILTAITTEMSSFSSSLNTTSFFKVRLHNLPRAKAQRGPHPPTPPGAPGRPHPRERWPPTWPPQEPLWGAGRSPACGAAPGRSVGRQAGSPQGPGARYGAPLPAPGAQASARAAPCPPPPDEVQDRSPDPNWPALPRPAQGPWRHQQLSGHPSAYAHPQRPCP